MTEELNPFQPPEAEIEMAPMETDEEVKYFPVSNLKLVLMGLATLNFYLVYWCYKNWKYIKLTGEDIWPVPRAIFSGIMNFSLFPRIRSSAEGMGLTVGWSPTGLAFLTLILGMTYKLPGSFSLITYVVVFGFIPIQNTINEMNVGQPESKMNRSFSGWNVLALVLGGILWLFIFAGVFLTGFEQ